MVVTINGRPPNYSGDEMPLVDQLRQELKLAEEGLANYAQENQELRGTLQELRIRLHSAGRRPEECYEMSIIDAALAQHPRVSPTK